MLDSLNVAQRCKELGITVLHIKFQVTGGNRTRLLDRGPSQPSEPLPQG